MPAIKDDTSGESGAGIGTVSYNGYTFPPVRNVRLVGTPVYDEADRTIVRTAYLLQVHSLVWAASATAEAANFDTIRTALLTAGKELTINGIGFSNLVIPTTNLDLKWGPKPRHCEFSPIAGLIAWDLNWSVEFSLTECNEFVSGGLSFTPNFMSFNFDIVFTVNEKGLSSRTVSGYYEIAQSRQAGSRRTAATADTKWDQVRINVPIGFKRVQNQRKLSKDANRMDFQITDEELSGLPYPEGIVAGDLEYSVENTNIGFAQHIGSITGSLETAPNQPVSLAAAVFVKIAQAKLLEFKNNVGNNCGLVVQKVRLSRGLFGRRSSFGISFLLTGTASSILSKTGIWTPVPNTGYQQWAASMSDNWGNRGLAGLRFSGETIIDLCSSVNAVEIETGGYGSDQSPGYEEVTFKCDVTRENSWLAYDNAVIAQRKQTARIHKFGQNYQNQEAFTPTQADNGQVPVGVSYTGIPDVVQYRSLPDDEVVMVGRALRVMWPPDIPSLKSINGRKVIELERKVEVKEVADFLGCKCYFARWAILYKLGEPIETLPAQPNPITDSNGGVTLNGGSI